MGKAFDKVPHGVMVGTAKAHENRKIIQWIEMIYHGATTMCDLRQDSQHHSKDRVHQGSVLSPLLFITVIDAGMEVLKRQPPWALLYVDDVVFMAEKRKVQEEV
ncbi:unnamed protein product [Strongylus vulgaris]|uniref:Reverse transcriptase domain-containing protein n=1 Tax=Strongylus vulgaris TaxID=40348 RepID=A0A3P7IZU1_STRVU|nr:unnamed protein product [Strongylus vulgaris]